MPCASRAWNGGSGALDATFASNLGFGPDGAVNTVGRDSLGRFVIGGAFTAVGALNSTIRIARIGVNGTPDSNFFPGAGVEPSTVNSLVVDASDRAVLGGDFTTFDGVAVNRVVRVTSTGELDTRFGPASSAGKYLIAGDFTTVNGTAVTNVARLFADGALDTTFSTGSGASNGFINCVAIDQQGSVYLGGSFTSFNGVASPRLVKLNVSGAVDAAFAATISPGPNLPVQALAVDTAGDIYVGGDFTQFGGTAGWAGW